MVAEVRVDLKSREVSAALERLRLSLPLGGDLSPAMRSMARVLKTGAQLRFRTATDPDGQPWLKSRRVREEGGQTLSLTRRLRNSLTTAADHNTATVGTNVAYAAIHQFGGVIRAKSGPFLTIPLTADARRTSPRNMPGLHFAETVKGNFVLANDKGVPQYLLRRQVTMPARPFLGASDSDRAELLSVLQQHLAGQWKR